MKLTLRHDEPVVPGLKRLLDEQLNAAAAALVRGGDPASVHATRRCCKKTRALLRLLRVALGEHYATLDAMVRDAARALACARDAAVVSQTLRALTRDGGKRRATVQRLAGQLATTEGPGEAACGQEDGARAQRLIEQARRTLAGLSLPAPDADVMLVAFGRTYARGRRALRAVQSRPDDPEAYHALRRQVKYHMYQLRILTSVWPALFQAWADEADALGACLGEEHDLTVLCGRLARAAPLAQDARVLARTARRRQRALRLHARRQAGLLYAERRRALVARLQAYWSVSTASAPASG